MDEKIEVHNVNSPNHVTRVDKAKYMAIYECLMKVIPDTEPGATPSDLIAQIKPIVDQDLFPGGDKVGWWLKCVQLDLEAKKVIARAPKPPVRLHKV